MDVKQLPVIHRNKLKPRIVNRVRACFYHIYRRPIGSVFEEIGADSPEEVSLDKVKPDRSLTEENWIKL